jgi:hypothetical protein
MHLALTGLFRAKWTADIHEEWISALLRNRPDLTRTKLERTRMLMDQHATDALVTINLRDFPPEAVAPFGIEAQHPDEFILHLLDLAPGVVARAAQVSPTESQESCKDDRRVSEHLEAQGLTQTVSLLREYGF